MVNLVGKKEN